MELLAGIIMIILPFAYGGVNHYNEGKKCVGSNVQVGDTVQTRDGSQLTVVEVDGPSIFCKDLELPIKATLTKEK